MNGIAVYKYVFSAVNAVMPVRAKALPKTGFAALNALPTALPKSPIALFVSFLVGLET